MTIVREELLKLPPLPRPWGYARNMGGRIEISVGPNCPQDTQRGSGYFTPWAAMFGFNQLQDYARAAVELSRRPSLVTNEQWRIGDDYQDEEQLATAGITIGGHGNAIEVYAEQMELAKHRRDSILSLLSRAKQAAQPQVSDVIAKQLDTPGNRHPSYRYDGYKGQPLSPSATHDQTEAWKEGRRAAGLDQALNPLQMLRAALCDPDGRCCIAGSQEDRHIVDEALSHLSQPAAQSAQVPKGWSLYRVNDNCIYLHAPNGEWDEFCLKGEAAENLRWQFIQRFFDAVLATPQPDQGDDK